MDFSIGDANRFLDRVELPLGAVGFIQGAIGQDIKIAVDQGLWNNYTMEQKAKYILHNLAGRLAGQQIYPEFGTAPPFKINMTGWANKGLLIALAAYFYKELGLPYNNTVHKILWPIGVGWTVGGIFDPPNSTIPALGKTQGFVNTSYFGQ